MQNVFEPSLLYHIFRKLQYEIFDKEAGIIPAENSHPLQRKTDGTGAAAYGTAWIFSASARFFYDGLGKEAARPGRAGAGRGRSPGRLPGGAAPRPGRGHPPHRPVLPGSHPAGGPGEPGPPGGPGAGGGPGDPDPGPPDQEQPRPHRRAGGGQDGGGGGAGPAHGLRVGARAPAGQAAAQPGSGVHGGGHQVPGGV